MNKEDMVNELKCIKEIMYPKALTYDMGVQFLYANSKGFYETFGLFCDWPLVRLQSTSKKLNAYSKYIQDFDKIKNKIEKRPNKTFYLLIDPELDAEVYYDLKSAKNALYSRYRNTLKLTLWEDLDECDLERYYEEIKEVKKTFVKWHN